MLIQVHLLQNFGPTNFNRGEDGKPKSVMFGQHLHARSSSQRWKRDIRTSERFRRQFAEPELGIRTVELPEKVGAILREMKLPEATVSQIVAKVPEIGRAVREPTQQKGAAISNPSGPGSRRKKRQNNHAKPSSDGNEKIHPATKQLIYFSENEVRALANEMYGLYKEVGKKGWSQVHMEERLGRTYPEAKDIALFGRWVTSNKFDTVRGVTQFMHPISTHAMAREFDWYTGIDDVSGKAGAMGYAEFNSSLYYRYFNVHWDELKENLRGNRDDALRVLGSFLDAAINVVPQGMINSYAHFNLPDWILIEISLDNFAMNYANAFLSPVRVTANENIMELSIAQLEDYVVWNNLGREPNYSRAVWARKTTLADGEHPIAKHFQQISILLRWVMEHVRAWEQTKRRKR